jgi:hypothetical protein
MPKPRFFPGITRKLSLARSGSVKGCHTSFSLKLKILNIFVIHSILKYVFFFFKFFVIFWSDSFFTSTW